MLHVTPFCCKQVSGGRSNARSHRFQPYLGQGAVAIPGRLCIEVVMVEDGAEAGDHGLQGSAVLLNVSHARDQTRGNGAVRQVGGPAQDGNVVLTYYLQGCKHGLVIHI